MSSRRLNLEEPRSSRRRGALKDFSDLLSSSAAEAEWQVFFDHNPFILTETLPLRLDALFTQVPLVNGVPDYVFCRNSRNGMTGDYGVIELKRPDQPVIGTYSSKIITPSMHLRTAQQQASQYLESIQRGEFLNADDFIAAGNRRVAFIILGSSSEITRKCASEIRERQFRSLLPAGFHLYAYDELFDFFSSSVPPVVSTLFAYPVEGEVRELTSRFTVSNGTGLWARPLARLYHTCTRFGSQFEFEVGGQTAKIEGAEGFAELFSVSAQAFTVKATGVDAVEALTAISELVENYGYSANG